MAARWEYVGEGAAHAVGRRRAGVGVGAAAAADGDAGTRTAISDEDIPGDDGQVLRVRKASAGARLDADAEARRLRFGTEVVAPLLGPRYIVAAEAVPLTPAAVDALAAAWAPHRPPHRRAVPLDRTASTALRMHNATLLPGPSTPATTAPTVAVELKPKWGYLPAAPWAAPRKRATCRFCMHRALKRATGTDAREQAATIAHDAFCPLDLYSPDPDRAHRALGALLDGPGNNLRLFVDGRRVFRDPDAEAAAVIGVPDGRSAVAALLARLGLPTPADLGLVAVLAAILRAEPVLATLQRVQQDLDSLDIEGAHAVYGALAAAVPGGTLAVERALQDLADLAPWMAAVQEPVGDLPATLAEAVAAAPERQWAWLRRFLVATTLKDCSVFVALRPAAVAGPDRLQGEAASDLGHITVTHDMGAAGPARPQGAAASDNGLGVAAFDYRVQVVDLDPKDPARIPYWHHLDRSIVDHAESIRLTRHCRP